jgi:hypothetical protein
VTMRYVEVVQLDLQREFHRARQNPLVLHSIPPSSLFHPPPPLLNGLTSLRFAKLSLLPAIFSNYSSHSWSLRPNVNFAGSRSASLTSDTNSIASPQMSAH